jgi:hypothetical protein
MESSLRGTWSGTCRVMWSNAQWSAIVPDRRTPTG